MRLDFWKLYPIQQEKATKESHPTESSDFNLQEL